jgi:hypothetical protein
MWMEGFICGGCDEPNWLNELNRLNRLLEVPICRMRLETDHEVTE